VERGRTRRPTAPAARPPAAAPGLLNGSHAARVAHRLGHLPPDRQLESARSGSRRRPSGRWRTRGAERRRRSRPGALRRRRTCT
jgi:hypothetical protein